MADDESLGEYLDRLIYSLYGSVQRGYGYLSKSPLHSAVIEYIEDEDTGRPHPIDDSADHYLLRAFDRARRELFTLDVPKKNGFFGEVRGWYGTWVTPKGQPHYTNEISGEIPWRCYHPDPEWPCTECNHPEKFHSVDHDGWHYCSNTDHGNCNCGNNIGR